MREAASCGISRPDRTLQAARHADQELISSEVVKAVVDHLEAIEIEEEDGEKHGAAFSAGDGLLESVH